MLKYCVWLLLIAPSFGYTKVINTASLPVVVATEGKALQRVCYYKDQAYSIGAVIQVGELYMICQEANDFETNGPLRWELLTQQK